MENRGGVADQKRAWYRPIGAEFIRLTQGMAFEPKAALGMVFDLMVDYRGDIPDDSRWIAGVLGVSTRKWCAIRRALIDGAKLTVTNGRLIAPQSGKYAAAQSVEAGAKTENSSVEIATKSQDNLAEKQATSSGNNGLEGAPLSSRAIGLGLELGQGQNPPVTPPPRDGREGDGFDEFWRAWRPEPGASRVAAVAAWNATAAVRPDLQTMLACVACYLDDHDRNNAERRASKRAHLNRYAVERWLREQRWEGYLAAASAALKQQTADAADEAQRDELWNGKAVKLAALVGAPNFKAWFSKVEVDGDVLRAPSPVVRDNIWQRFHYPLVDVFGPSVRVELKGDHRS